MLKKWVGHKCNYKCWGNTKENLGLCTKPSTLLLPTTLLSPTPARLIWSPPSRLTHTLWVILHLCSGIFTRPLYCGQICSAFWTMDIWTETPMLRIIIIHLQGLFVLSESDSYTDYSRLCQETQYLSMRVWDLFCVAQLGRITGPPTARLNAYLLNYMGSSIRLLVSAVTVVCTL